jgi:hypothetical protein
MMPLGIKRDVYAEHRKNCGNPGRHTHAEANHRIMGRLAPTHSRRTSHLHVYALTCRLLAHGARGDQHIPHSHSNASSTKEGAPSFALPALPHARVKSWGLRTKHGSGCTGLIGHLGIFFHSTCLPQMRESSRSKPYSDASNTACTADESLASCQSRVYDSERRRREKIWWPMDSLRPGSGLHLRIVSARRG